jgi:dihydroorotate dehydrogenase electron transfer subunit
VSALAARGTRSTLIYGARTSRDLPLLEWFRERCAAVVVATEDGSAGHRGLVTEPLEQALSDAGAARIYACGPNPMLKAVAEIARSRGVRCEMSLEAHMACGFGVCLGCVVPTRSESAGETVYERVCVEGPLMPAEKLAW